MKFISHFLVCGFGVGAGTTESCCNTGTVATQGQVTNVLLNAIVFTGTYDALQRRTAFGVRHGGLPIVSQAYTNDAASRLSTATAGALPIADAYYPNR